MHKPKLLLLIGATLGFTATIQDTQPKLPDPDYANVKYGNHERNVFDIWLAESGSLTPLVVYYHSGGFRRGDKKSLPVRLLQQLRSHGISVAAVNYRLSGTKPYPAQMHDSARALQYIRFHSNQYNVDPGRVGATGGSAGSGISQWLAFHDDLANPNSSDPVQQQSTRLTAIVPYNAQCSYDPRFIKKLMDTDQVEEALIPFFGMRPASDVENPQFHSLFEDASPINHLTPDDPPILVYYNQRNDPLPPNSPGKLHIHHPRFGFALKEKADELGVECTMLLRDDYPDGYPIDKFVKFLVEKLG